MTLAPANNSVEHITVPEKVRLDLGKGGRGAGRLLDGLGIG